MAKLDIITSNTVGLGLPVKLVQQENERRKKKKKKKNNISDLKLFYLGLGWVLQHFTVKRLYTQCFKRSI